MERTYTSKYRWSQAEADEAETRIRTYLERHPEEDYAYRRAAKIEHAAAYRYYRPRTDIAWAVRMVDGTIETCVIECDAWTACNGLRELPDDMRARVYEIKREAKRAEKARKEAC